MPDRTLIACFGLLVAAVAVTWWVYGVGPLVIALAALALACPAVGFWVTREQRRINRQQGAAKKGGP
jgi:membrane protein implicated in regulation of membrane protease activity